MPRIDILMVGNEIFAKQLTLIHSLLVRTKDKHLKSNLHLELGIISRKGRSQIIPTLTEPLTLMEDTAKHVMQCVNSYFQNVLLFNLWVAIKSTWGAFEEAQARNHTGPEIVNKMELETT